MTDVVHLACLTTGTTPLEDLRPTRAAAADDALTPIDHYLREQQQLTAVERFSQRHDGDLLPSQARYYRELIPLDRPAPGQQYGFEVDLDACTGCKACVAACHRLNGLDDGEAFRSVGTLVGTARTSTVEPSLGQPTVIEPWQQAVTTACHHCIEPACLNGCPVDAYEKDPITGIVKHLDDQCIGCSYCTLTCPYEVPTFNQERGIVRKCDLCSDRLADGEAPACVQACPTSAISVAIVDVATIAETTVDADAALVPAAPASRLTQPTTRYRSTRPMPADALPADHFSVVRGHAHLPLTVMLVLTQMSVGAFVGELILRHFASAELADSVRPVEAAGALIVGLVALGASVLHLGRPLYAWRAVIGIGHSWLSREIVAFSAFAGAAGAYAASVLLVLPVAISDALGLLTAMIGVVGVACSVMIYVVTGRYWWRMSGTGSKFVGTTVITGLALTLALATVGASMVDDAAAVLRSIRPLMLAVGVASIVKLIGEASLFRHLRDEGFTELRRTAMLLEGDLWRVVVARFALGIIGGVIVPLVLVASWSEKAPSIAASIVLAMTMVVAVLAGELVERWLFFTASSAPRMPGGFR